METAAAKTPPFDPLRSSTTPRVSSTRSASFSVPGETLKHLQSPSLLPRRTPGLIPFSRINSSILQMSSPVLERLPLRGKTFSKADVTGIQPFFGGFRDRSRFQAFFDE